MGVLLAHHRLGSAVLQSGGHGLVLAPENLGTTEQPEYMETKLKRAGIPFRVFRVFRGLKTSESGGHGLVLIPENQGTTEQPEYTETNHNRARIPFRVFRVFRG
jgi:hypothetical protein